MTARLSGCAAHNFRRRWLLHEATGRTPHAAPFLLRLCQAKRVVDLLPFLCNCPHCYNSERAAAAGVRLIRSNGGCNAAASPAHQRSKSLALSFKGAAFDRGKDGGRKAKARITGLVTHTTGLRKGLSREGLSRNLNRAGRSSTPSLRARRCGRAAGRHVANGVSCLHTGGGHHALPLTRMLASRSVPSASKV